MTAVIGLFDNIDIAQRAAEDLMRRGLHRDQVDMISHATNLSRRSHPRTGPDLFAETRQFSFPGIGAVFAEGPVAAMLARAERGEISGGLVGVLVNLDLHEADAGPYAEAVRRGGTIVVAKCDDELVQAVRDLLRREGSIDIAERAKQWHKNGWVRFDPRMPPYTAAELDKERAQNYQRLEQQSGESFPTSGAGGGVWSGIAPHTRDEAQIKAHAEAERLEAMHANTAGPEFSGRQPVEPFLDHFRAHFEATYAGMGSHFEEYEPAYRFGALLAENESFSERDWRTAVDDVQVEWEKAHTSTWEHYRDAIRFGWGVVRGSRYQGPERRKQTREENARYFW